MLLQRGQLLQGAAGSRRQPTSAALSMSKRPVPTTSDRSTRAWVVGRMRAPGLRRRRKAASVRRSAGQVAGEGEAGSTRFRQQSVEGAVGARVQWRTAHADSAPRQRRTAAPPHPPASSTRSVLFSRITSANSICRRHAHQGAVQGDAVKGVLGERLRERAPAGGGTMLEAARHLVQQQVRHVALAARRLGPLTVLPVPTPGTSAGRS